MTPLQILKPAAFVGGLILVSSFANAASISYKANFSLSDSVNSGSNTTGSFTDNLYAIQTEYLPKFDPSLGTLNSITLEFFGFSQNSRANANFRDTDYLSKVGGHQNLYSMSISADILGISYNRSSSNRTSSCTDKGSVTGSAASCNTNISSLTQYMISQNNLISSPSELTAFIGTGTIQARVRQNGLLFTNETDGDDGYVNSRYGLLQTQGTIRAIYDFTEVSPVPVPSAAWLFGSALLGLTALRRKKK